MSNLLPESAKRARWRMYRARFIVAGSWVALAAAALSALALLPAYLALTFGGSSASKDIETIATIREDRIALAHAQSLIRVLSPLLSTSTQTALIDEALSVRPSGVTVSHIAGNAGHPGTIVISGLVKRTELVSAYQSALRSNPHFASVLVPVGDLAGNEDGTFSVTLTADF